MMMNSRRAIVTATSYAQRRMMSAAPPRAHKAKDFWPQIEATRPKDPHPHNVFHPPYDKTTVTFMVVTVVALGYGTMYVGMRHQMRKQGYWK